MELRFAEGARATKKIDIGFSGERAARLGHFQNTFALGFDEFSFRLKDNRNLIISDAPWPHACTS